MPWQKPFRSRKQQWLSLVIGWLCGTAAYFLIPIPDGPAKLILVFGAGFVSASIVYVLFADRF